MNGSFYNNNGMYNGGYPNYEGNKIPVEDSSSLPMEQSYIENILRINKGAEVTVFASFPDAVEWRDREFKGYIEEAGRDHIILRGKETNDWYLILMIYLNYVKFEEKINYVK